MANFCPNCGQSVDPNAVFCHACGQSLSGGATVGGAQYQQPAQQYVQPSSPTVSDVIGTLVAVNLVGGLTRQLYYYGGRYFLDPYCRTPFNDYRLIVGGHRLLRPMAPPRPPRPMGRPMGPRPPMGRPPMGGGPKGPRGRR